MLTRRNVALSTAGVGVLTALALALRLYGIGHQGLWFDEAYTVMLVKQPFGHMLTTVGRTESTPYLYYILAWVWTHIFGRGAADLRALSALFGAAVVPVLYLTALRLLRGNRRAALAAAALAACNPLLIWYSQEARAYELLALTSACSLLAFAYAAERPTRARLACWALACGLALATHYDAALLVVPEALWLLYRHTRRLGVWLAVAFAAACGGALLPLLIAQNHAGNAAWIKRAPLNDRLGQILPQFLLGTGSHRYVELMWAGFLLAALALLLVARSATSSERTVVVGLCALALSGFAIEMIVVAAGTDDLLTRNLLALWPPLALAVAAGCGAARARRIGAAIALGLCAIGLVATFSVATDAAFQRPDWPAVAAALGRWPSPRAPAGSSRLLIFQQNVWLESLTNVYMSDARKLYRKGRYTARGISAIDVVANSAPRSARPPHAAVKHWLCWWGAACNLTPSRLRGSYPIPGFHTAGIVHVKQFSILRLVAATPHAVTRAELRAVFGVRGLGAAGILIQRSAAG